MPIVLHVTGRRVLGFFIEMFPPITIAILVLMMAAPEPPSCAPSTGISSIAALRKLPRELQQELTSHLPDLVYRGEQFEATDVGTGPRRRFITAARSGGRWVVAYEHGGIGYHIHVVAFDWSNHDERPSLISNRMSYREEFCKEISARLRDEPIPADRTNAEDWNY